MNAFKILCISFSLFLSLTANAGFYRPDQLPEDRQIANIPQILNSAHHLVIGAQKCSSFFVSSEGHLLTNLHCVDICLFREDLLKNFGQAGVHLDINQRQGNGRLDLACPEVNIPALGLTDVRIQYIGRGFANFDDFEVDRLSDESLSRLQDIFTGDFAVLKFEVKNQACLPVRQTPLAKEDLIWMAGFPSATYRPGYHGSDGINLFFSFGRLGASIRQNVFFQAYAPSELFWQRQEFWSQQFLISNLDSAFGASGSPWLDQNAQVVALNAGIAGPNLRQNVERAYDYSSLALPIQNIVEIIKADAGQEFVDQVFNCKP